MAQNDSELEKQIKKCFTDTQMAHDEELELFDTDQTIKNISALFIAYTNAEIAKVLDRLDKTLKYGNKTIHKRTLEAYIQAERAKLKEVK